MKLVLVFLGVLVVVRGSYQSDASDGPIVRISHGLVKGIRGQTAEGKQYSAFLGVPFAKPPVGENRFKDPQERKSWKGIWPADSQPSPCLQHVYLLHGLQNPIFGAEDCLYLNVYVPKADLHESTPLLDVVALVYGGAFMMGNVGSMQLHNLLNENLIVVEMNYRVGILGFLSTEDEASPGNYGLKDQALALKWIQRNIEEFGGNSSSVTLTGISAGGASVHFHYLSPLSKGTFHRGISLSGTTLMPWALTEAPKKKAQQVAQYLGCGSESSEDMVECLKSRPAKSIVQLATKFLVWNSLPITPFGPIIENPSPTAFISQDPIKIITEGKAQNLPWLVGVTSEEGIVPGALYCLDDEKMKEFNARYHELIPFILDYNFTVPKDLQNTVSDKIKKHYVGDEEFNRNNVPQHIKMIGDRLFMLGAERAAKTQATVNSAPVYFYVFKYRGTNSFSKFLSGKDDNLGTSHGDDIGYLMAFGDKSPHLNSEEVKMSNALREMWRTFASNGTPLMTNVIWDPVRPHAKKMKYLLIQSPEDMHMTEAEDIGDGEFWDSLPIVEPQLRVKSLSKKDDL